MTEDSCPDEGTYVKVAGTIIFVLVWPFVVFDIKYYPVGRPGAALIGAVGMVVFGIVSQGDVYNNILGSLDNLQTLFLLIGMMLLSYYYDREGMLPYLASKIFGKAGNKRSFYLILWQVCVLSGVLSAFITNDATAVVLTPIFVNAHIKQGRGKEEILTLLIAIATSCNIGSAATIFGNPQNAFIASSAGVSLLDALITLLPSAAVGLALNIVMLYAFYVLNLYWHQYCERRHRNHSDVVATSPMEGVTNNVDVDNMELGVLVQSFTTLQSAHQRLYPPRVSASYPNLTQVTNEQGNDHRYHELHDIPPPAIDHINISNATQHTENVSRWVKIKKILFISWLVFITILVVVLLAIPDCPGNKNVMFNLGLVPVAAGILTMMVDAALNGHNASLAISDIDWSLIALFMGLFVWLNGFERTGFPCEIVEALRDELQITKVSGVLLFTILVSAGSNIFSNVPLVILIVDQLDTLCGNDFENCHLLGGSILAWVSTIAGNLTLFGSICNLIVAEKSMSCAKLKKVSNENDYQLSFFGYLIFGVVSTVIVVFAGLPVVYFSADAIRESNFSGGNGTCVNATDF